MSFIRIQKLVAAIKECSDLKTGEELHREAVSRTLHSNKYVTGALIKMYSRLHSISLARQAFDSISSPDVVAWNSIILAYADNGESTTAMDLFTSMSCEPSFVTYVAAAQACKNLPLDRTFRLEKGIGLHIEACSRGLHSDVILGNALSDMYSRCGSMKHARKCFESMTERSSASWNSLMQGYVENGESWTALELFSCMDCQRTPVTYVTALKACSELSTEEELGEFCVAKATEIHKDIKSRGFNSDVVIGTSLVDVYGKLGNMKLAEEVFNGMAGHRSVITWTSLIQGYVESGESFLALGLFCISDCAPDGFMYVTALKACGALALENRWFSLEKGVSLHKQVRSSVLESEVVVAAALVDMYRRSGSMLHARRAFDRMMERSVAAWNSLILGYVDNGDVLEALTLFGCMDCDPSSVTYVAALKSCGSLAGENQQLDKRFCLDLGIGIHKRVIERKLETETPVATALLDMYCKCGSMAHARRVFDGMISKDVVAWTSLILGYVNNGESVVAMDLFVSMDCKPNAFTYSAAIKACGCLSALEAGERIHGVVCRLGLEEDQLIMTALVDLYGRCGSVGRAEALFSCMHTVDVVSWNSMIVAYSSRGETDRVFGVVRDMQETGSEVDNATVGCVLALCSHAGLVDVGRRWLRSSESCGRIAVEHYNSMVDVLTRAGQVKEAAALVREMAGEANEVTWTSLLGGFRLENPDVGKILLQ